VKLVLANNQSPKFVDFYQNLQEQRQVAFDYAGYDNLLFRFKTSASQPIEVVNLKHGHELSDYDGVYINGYLNTYELAATVAIACDHYGIAYANQELHQPPSLSKLTMYAKLAAAGISIPDSLAGTKKALMIAAEELENSRYPAILKRADADRGVDNYKVSSASEVLELLGPHPERSLWVLQDFIDNDGFYLISFYDQQPKFCIHRRLESRPDGNVQKAHMYKPKGGSNASLIELADAPEALVDTCRRAVEAMNRQVASVDCLFNPQTNQATVLEVNYNPQLVTIETFKDIRVDAFVEYLKNSGD
jgi:hypothetical protein